MAYDIKAIINSPDFAEGLKDIIMDDYIEYKDKAELYEMLIEDIKGDFEVYTDRGDSYVVKNVKSKGYPNMSKLATAISKKTGWDDEAIEKWLDNNFYDIWLESVQFYQENLEFPFPISVVGRSGGYWGFNTRELGNNFEVDIDGLVKYIKSGKVDKELDKTAEENIEYDFNDYDFAQELYKEIAEEDFLPYIQFNKEMKDTLENFAKQLDAEIKYRETIDPWLDEFEANTWYGMEYDLEIEDEEE